MKYEKSCGAVIYRIRDGKTEYLAVLNKKGNAKGHWGFPKGHTEPGENEYQTAAREILEETGISVVFCGNVREVSSYSPSPDIQKDAVYFLATPKNGCEMKIQESEIADYKWLTGGEIRKILTFDAALFDKILKEM